LVLAAMLPMLIEDALIVTLPASPGIPEVVSSELTIAAPPAFNVKLPPLWYWRLPDGHPLRFVVPESVALPSCGPAGVVVIDRSDSGIAVPSIVEPACPVNFAAVIDAGPLSANVAPVARIT
jgi:hypothetical protein